MPPDWASGIDQHPVIAACGQRCAESTFPLCFDLIIYQRKSALVLSAGETSTSHSWRSTFQGSINHTVRQCIRARSFKNAISGPPSSTSPSSLQLYPPSRLHLTMSTPLCAALERALQERQRRLVPTPDLYDDVPFLAADLFSNDYLSLCTDLQLRQAFLDKVSQMPLVFGSGGSRLMSGNSPAHLQFEERMIKFFRAPSALLFNSGYDANVAFWHAVPQAGDAVIFDELVHASTRDGLLGSRARNAVYPFSHNSMSSLSDTILRVLAAHQAIASGHATLFIAVESLYSMDGDFAPLSEIVQLVEQLIPPGCGHIVVDEAHSTGLYGSHGRGLVSALGLENRVDTVLHTFGKARALTGGM